MRHWKRIFALAQENSSGVASSERFGLPAPLASRRFL
jgi:hypothetical protein